MKESDKEKMWDVAVIGGGAAGMMAAGRAAELGASVVLIEKNDSLGKKLLITGGGRCNVANAEFDTKVLLGKYKDAGKFLASPFSQWDAASSIEFFEGRGMPTKVENEKRAFPVSNSARSVWETLVEYLRKGNVTVISNVPTSGFVSEMDHVVSAKLPKKRTIRAKSFILATGGISRPETGSTGDGFAWLRALGHKVDESSGALVPIALKESWIKNLAGISLKEAKLTISQDGFKQGTRTGKVLFTHVGISGPAVLNMSREIGELLREGSVELSLDLFPEQGYEKVDGLLKEIFSKHSNKMIKNSFGTAIPSGLVPALLALADIAPEKFCNSVTRSERIRLMKILKGILLHVSHLLGLEKAIVTSGGLALDEIDFKTMRSKRYKNLYVVGDILDIDRPSGGYSLQLCWTTGFVAGSSAAQANN